MAYQVHTHFDDGTDEDQKQQDTAKPGKPQPPADRKELPARETEILTGLARWVGYSAFMAILLCPFITGLHLIAGALLLGHFSAQLNSLKE